MPYGISDTSWAMMTLQDQTHARRRVENARQGDGAYGSPEQAKAANAAQWEGGGSSNIVQPMQNPAGAWTEGGQFYDAPAAPMGDPYGGDGGGGGYGGGGYGGGGYIGSEIIPYPEPPPPPKLAESPEWLAYLNALGLEKGQFEADIAKQRGFLQSDAERQIGDLKPQYDQQRRGITGSLEARGVVRSGEFLRKIAENRATQGRQEGGIRAGLQGNIVNLESQLAQRLIDIDARKAERELQMRSQGYV